MSLLIEDKKSRLMPDAVISRGLRRLMAITLFMLIGVTNAMATEEAPYTVIKTDDIFELREYAPRFWLKSLLTETWKVPETKPSGLCFATSPVKTDHPTRLL